MVFLIGVPLIAILATYLWHEYYVTNEYMKHDFFFYFVNVVVGVAVALLLAVMSGEVIGGGPQIEKRTFPIESVSASSQVEGSFFLGSGTVEGKRFYAFWTSQGTRNPDALRRMVVWDDESSVEVVEGTEDPRVQIVERSSKVTVWAIYNEKDDLVTIHIPEGSINHTYSVQ